MPQRPPIAPLLAIIIFPLILLGCIGNTVYFHYKSTSSGGWNKQDTLGYQLPSRLTSQQYLLEIGLRHTDNYPYRDIWLEMRRPLSPNISPDTLHLTLADQSGRWYGSGTAGKLYQFMSSPSNIHLQATDSLIQLVHIMRDSCLVGVTEIGIRLSFTSGIDTQKDK